MDDVYMNKKRSLFGILLFVAFGLLVALDQITKYLTIFYLKPLDTFPIIQDVLHLTYVENTGAAFGMMKDARWVFMLTSTVAIVGILVYMFVKRPTDKLLCTSLSFIVGGGIGNMIDRTILGYVVDMIDLRLIQFAVFNVADSFVCVGAGMMILYLILDMIREAKAEKAAAETAAAEAESETVSQGETVSQEEATPGEEADHA
jgi:signal peptidase II